MTIKQLITYVRLLWKVKNLDIKMTKLDIERIKVFTYAYQIRQLQLENPEITKYIQEEDSNAWENFNINFEKLKMLDDYVKSLRGLEASKRGKNTGNSQT